MAFKTTKRVGVFVCRSCEPFLKVSKEYPVYMGLNIAEHIQKLRNHFNQVIEYHKWADPLSDYPYIVLILGKEIEPRRDRTIMKRTQDVVTREEKEYLKYILRAEYEGYGMISEGYRRRNF